MRCSINRQGTLAGVGLAAAALALITLMTSGCGAGAVPARESVVSKPAVPAGSLLLQGAGATFPSVLYDRWFNQYRSNHPDRIITYDPVGSGEGVRRFIGVDVSEEERIDFGASDAAMRDDEMARVPAGALLLPVTAGSVGLAYNLPDLSAD